MKQKIVNYQFIKLVKYIVSQKRYLALRLLISQSRSLRVFISSFPEKIYIIGSTIQRWFKT
jgi:hypothetical protein